MNVNTNNVRKVKTSEGGPRSQRTNNNNFNLRMVLDNQYKVFNMDSNHLNKKMFVDSMIPNPQQQQPQ